MLNKLSFPKLSLNKIDIFIKSELKETPYSIIGFKQIGTDIFVFIKFSYTSTLSIGRNYHIAILDEILNKRMCNNIHFNNNVVQLFFKNKDLIYTYALDDTVIDHPILNNEHSDRVIIHNNISFYL